MKKSAVKKGGATTLIGHAIELAMSLDNGGWTKDQIGALREDDLIGRLHDVVRGFAEIKPVEHIIDLSADPFIPPKWRLAKHRKAGVVRLTRKGDDLYIEDKKIQLYLSDSQKKNRAKSYHLYLYLQKRLVLNANVLEYLLENKYLIPDSWKRDKKGPIRIYFWGTEYRNSAGALCIRCLFWDDVDGAWVWDENRTTYDWDSSSPAAIEGRPSRKS